MELDTSELVPIVVVLGVALLLVLSAYAVGRARRAQVISSERSPGPATRKSAGVVAPAAASLYMVGGAAPGTRFPLDPAGTYLGRKPDNQIHIDAPLVSRTHALIQSQDGVWRITDLDSTNGTWVNGQRVADQTLTGDDRIQIGPAIFAFQLAGNERIPTPRPATAREAPIPPPLSNVQQIHDLGDYDMTFLGRGGEGVVYRGVSRSDGSVVAIKILESQDPYLAAKFKQAGNVGLMLRHPYIVATYHFGNQNDMFYIIMEFADGGALRDRMQPGMPYPVAEAVRVIGQTCDALDFAHRLNVIHRDVKPSNILFDRTNAVKLSDLGIAKLMTAPTITQAGLILGTPEYMSYEQARGQQVVPQSDIYSLGVVAYQLFTGWLPFTSEGSDPLKVLDQHLRERPRPPRQINPAIPEAVEKAILKALEKDVSKRFRTCEEFAKALGYKTPMYHAPAAQATTARLLVQPTGATLPVTEPELMIGRQLLGGHPTVSRSHARIRVNAGQYWLRDDNSTNGTYHNGQRVFDWELLNPGDEVVFGRVSTRFLIGDRPAPGQAPAGTPSRTRALRK